MHAAARKVLCRPLPRMSLARQAAPKLPHISTQGVDRPWSSRCQKRDLYSCIAVLVTRLFKTQFYPPPTFKSISPNNIVPVRSSRQYRNDRQYGFKRTTRRDGNKLYILPLYVSEANSSSESVFCLTSCQRCCIRRQASASPPGPKGCPRSHRTDRHLWQ